MSFLIRSISRSASGRDIVRPRRVKGDSVTVGRDPSNPVHLPDLAIRTQHARISRTGPKQVTVEALTDLPITIDDRQTKKRTLNIAGGVEIRLGGYLLAIAPGETPEEVTIDVTRVEGETITREEAARRFSLAWVAPGKRKIAYGTIALILLLFLAWPIWTHSASSSAKLTTEQLAGLGFHADSSWSTGPLSPAHAALEKNCKACHVGAFVAVQDNACASCHTDVHDHADTARLLKASGELTGWRGFKRSVGQFFGREPGRCVDCHLEHQGKQSIASTEQRFCTDCHGSLRERLADTPLGDAGDFATAHPEFRPLVMTTPGATPKFTRISMADSPTEESALKFPHDLHLSSTNTVARMAQTLGQGPMTCASCHKPDNDGTRFRPVNMEANCQQCHSLAFDNVGGTVRTLRHGDIPQIIADLREHAAAHPAQSNFVPGMRRRPGAAGFDAYRAVRFNADGAVRGIFSEGGACYDCHVIQPPAGGGVNYSVVPVRQSQRFLMHGWFDHNAHRTTECATCHKASASSSANDLLLPGIETCRTCHGGENAKAPAVPSTCAMCHDYHRTEGAPRAGRSAGGGGGSSPVAGAPLRLSWKD